MKKQKNIFIVTTEDLSRHSGFVNKVYRTVNVLSLFDVKTTLVGRNIDLKRIKANKNTNIIDLGNGTLAHLLVYFYILKPADYVYLPLTFNPLFIFQVLISKLSGKKVILHVGDPLQKTIKLMKKEVKRRLKIGVLVNVAEVVSGPIEKVMLLLSDHITVVSPSMKRDYIKFVGNKKSIDVIYNNVPEEPGGKLNEKFKEIRKRFKYVLIYFGQIQPEITNYEKLLYCFSKIKKRDRCLIFMGPDRTCGEFKKLVRRYNLQSRVFYFPPCEKRIALKHLKTTDALIIGPSPEFILSNKFFDAHNMKIPIIIPNNLRDVKEVFYESTITYDSDDDLIKKLDNLENFLTTKKFRKIETYDEQMVRFFIDRVGLRMNHHV